MFQVKKKLQLFFFAFLLCRIYHWPVTDCRLVGLTGVRTECPRRNRTVGWSGGCDLAADCWHTLGPNDRRGGSGGGQLGLIKHRPPAPARRDGFSSLALTAQRSASPVSFPLTNIRRVTPFLALNHLRTPPLPFASVRWACRRAFIQQFREGEKKKTAFWLLTV